MRELIEHTNAAFPTEIGRKVSDAARKESRFQPRLQKPLAS